MKLFISSSLLFLVVFIPVICAKSVLNSQNEEPSTETTAYQADVTSAVANMLSNVLLNSFTKSLVLPSQHATVISASSTGLASQKPAQVHDSNFIRIIESMPRRVVRFFSSSFHQFWNTVKSSTIQTFSLTSGLETSSASTKAAVEGIQTLDDMMHLLQTAQNDLLRIALKERPKMLRPILYWIHRHKWAFSNRLNGKTEASPHASSNFQDAATPETHKEVMSEAMDVLSYIMKDPTKTNDKIWKKANRNAGLNYFGADKFINSDGKGNEASGAYDSDKTVHEQYKQLYQNIEQFVADVQLIDSKKNPPKKPIHTLQEFLQDVRNTRIDKFVSEFLQRFTSICRYIQNVSYNSVNAACHWPLSFIKDDHSIVKNKHSDPISVTLQASLASCIATQYQYLSNVSSDIFSAVLVHTVSSGLWVLVNLLELLVMIASQIRQAIYICFQFSLKFGQAFWNYYDVSRSQSIYTAENSMSNFSALSKSSPKEWVSVFLRSVLFASIYPLRLIGIGVSFARNSIKRAVLLQLPHRIRQVQKAISSFESPPTWLLAFSKSMSWLLSLLYSEGDHSDTVRFDEYGKVWGDEMKNRRNDLWDRMSKVFWEALDVYGKIGSEIADNLVVGCMVLTLLGIIIFLIFQIFIIVEKLLTSLAIALGIAFQRVVNGTKIIGVVIWDLLGKMKGIGIREQKLPEATGQEEVPENNHQNDRETSHEQPGHHPTNNQSQQLAEDLRQIQMYNLRRHVVGVAPRRISIQEISVNGAEAQEDQIDSVRRQFQAVNGNSSRPLNRASTSTSNENWYDANDSRMVPQSVNEVEANENNRNISNDQAVPQLESPETQSATDARLQNENRSEQDPHNNNASIDEIGDDDSVIYVSSTPARSLKKTVRSRAQARRRAEVDEPDTNCDDNVEQPVAVPALSVHDPNRRKTGRRERQAEGTKASNIPIPKSLKARHRRTNVTSRKENMS